ncbi:MAG: tRNA lysidine(34) synthetase TilS [Pseudomonadota bacterium]|nr:tRNA lysidine(34) synthetase TilS [Pseudomonadota bacterium]
MLLAVAALPGRVEAATVDHGLRPQSADEADGVGRLCATMGIRHQILTVEWDEKPSGNMQAIARDVRYNLLCEWARGRNLEAVATAHHVDDQAETLLMRLNRGAGVGGLAGVHPSRPLGTAVGGETMIMLIRPLLTWRRVDLAAIVAAAGLTAIDDPSNADDRFDRTRARALLAESAWLDPARLAAVAKHCSDAKRALEWASWQEFSARQSTEGDILVLNAEGLPFELQRRLLVDAIKLLTGNFPAGPETVRALDALSEGRTVTLAGLKLEPGPPWRLSWTQPHRRDC